ncbi:MAG: hypothetical protein K2H87_09600, partial [Duncaniella sp.]|nr:hypothetical protein [Duncaniella sp.]
YERAKQIILEHRDGHTRLSETLLTKEVMYSEDLKEIFGPRQWKSRTEEILQLQAERDAERKRLEEKENTPSKHETEDNDGPEDVDAEDITDEVKDEKELPAAEETKTETTNGPVPPPYKKN